MIQINCNVKELSLEILEQMSACACACVSKVSHGDGSLN